MTAALLTIVVGAILLVRIGWGHGARDAAAAGWAAGAVALVALTMRDGAWGLAVGTVAGMTTALGIVLYAGWRSPARPRRTARTASPIGVSWHLPDLLRRLTVFLLVVPVAFAATQWFAFGVQAIARRGGMGEADAIVTTLLLQPTAWMVLMAIQVTRADTTRMLPPPLALAMLGTLLWSAS